MARLAIVCFVVACSRSAPAVAVEAAAPEPDAGELGLPARVGVFEGGSLTIADTYTRRTYARGDARVTVTIAKLPMDARGYSRWVEQSRSGYPQTTIVTDDVGNGFYECSDDAATQCNLLVQLRDGRHFEIRAEGSTTRADVDAIARGMPMR